MAVLLIGLLTLVCVAQAATTTTTTATTTTTTTPPPPATTTTTTELTTFRRMALPVYTSASLGEGWLSESELSCARTCLDLYASCYSVTYNTNSGMCTPGSRVTFIGNNSRGLGDEFYYANFCKGYLGFQVYLFDSLIQCVRISLTKMNFTLARKDCTDRGSRLYIPRSTEKLAFFRHVVNSITRGSTWAGLNDMLTEGVFVWEDGQAVDNRTFPVPWRPGMPDNAGGREDCVEMGTRGDFFYLNDQYCGDAANFICEMDMI